MLTDRDPAVALPALEADLKVVPLSTREIAAALAAEPDVLLVDGGENPGQAVVVLREARDAAPGVPRLAIVERADLERHPWVEVADDFLPPGATAAEIRTRLALLLARRVADPAGVLRLGPISLDRATFRVTAGGRTLDLTYKEFALLRHLAEHVGRVFTRPDLLREVWGYGFYGGTRTVDVHVRRLRAKLGPGLEGHIETVRGVGYRAVGRPAVAGDN